MNFGHPSIDAEKYEEKDRKNSINLSFFVFLLFKKPSFPRHYPVVGVPILDLRRADGAI